MTRLLALALILTTACVSPTAPQDPASTLTGQWTGTFAYDAYQGSLILNFVPNSDRFLWIELADPRVERPGELRRRDLILAFDVYWREGQSGPGGSARLTPTSNGCFTATIATEGVLGTARFCK